MWVWVCVWLNLCLAMELSKEKWFQLPFCVVGSFFGDHSFYNLDFTVSNWEFKYYQLTLSIDFFVRDPSSWLTPPVPVLVLHWWAQVGVLKMCIENIVYHFNWNQRQISLFHRYNQPPSLIFFVVSTSLPPYCLVLLHMRHPFLSYFPLSLFLWPDEPAAPPLWPCGRSPSF